MDEVERVLFDWKFGMGGVLIFFLVYLHSSFVVLTSMVFIGFVKFLKKIKLL
jgi:hypothetical protein